MKPMQVLRPYGQSRVTKFLSAPCVASPENRSMLEFTSGFVVTSEYLQAGRVLISW